MGSVRSITIGILQFPIIQSIDRSIIPNVEDCRTVDVQTIGTVTADSYCQIVTNINRTSSILPVRITARI